MPKRTPPPSDPRLLEAYVRDFMIRRGSEPSQVDAELVGIGPVGLRAAAEYSYRSDVALDDLERVRARATRLWPLLMVVVVGYIAAGIMNVLSGWLPSDWWNIPKAAVILAALVALILAMRTKA